MEKLGYLVSVGSSAYSPLQYVGAQIVPADVKPRDVIVLRDKSPSLLPSSSPEMPYDDLQCSKSQYHLVKIVCLPVKYSVVFTSPRDRNLMIPVQRPDSPAPSY